MTAPWTHAAGPERMPGRAAGWHAPPAILCLRPVATLWAEDLRLARHVVSSRVARAHLRRTCFHLVVIDGTDSVPSLDVPRTSRRRLRRGARGRGRHERRTAQM